MKGHGERLSRKQEQAITALLAESTIERAARSAGISVVTMWRWLQLTKFQAEYRAARRQIVEHAIASLQKVTSQAIESLSRNLSCGLPAVEVRAALGVLEQALKAQELLEIEARIVALEDLLGKRTGEVLP